MHSIWSRRWRCNENYLSFEHISDEEHHHTGINLIFYAPLEPSWYRLSKLCPNIVLWHNDQNEQHFSGQNQFRKYKIEAGWIIIGTLNRNLWITFGDYTGILFKCFPVATWIAGNICIKRMNWKWHMTHVAWLIRKLAICWFVVWAYQYWKFITGLNFDDGGISFSPEPPSTANKLITKQM